VTYIVAACCGVLQCVTVHCSVANIAVSIVMCVTLPHARQHFMAVCAAACCSVLQRGAVWCSVLQCIAVCGYSSVL